MRGLWARYSGFSVVARIIIAVALLLLLVGLGVRLQQAVKVLIFGNVEAKREHAGLVVAKEQGQAAKETGIEATGTVVRTYEHHVQVDHIVKESQNAITRADRGQQMDPGIDAAIADGLCRVHPDLCRVHDGVGRREQ